MNEQDRDRQLAVSVLLNPYLDSTGGWGLTLIPRDMARFGFLYLDRGIWDNNQVISKT